MSRCFTGGDLRYTSPEIFDKRLIIRVTKVIRKNKDGEDELVILDDFELESPGDVFCGYFLWLYNYYLITFTHFQTMVSIARPGFKRLAEPRILLFNTRRTNSKKLLMFLVNSYFNRSKFDCFGLWLLFEKLS